MILNYNFIIFDIDSYKEVIINYEKFLKLVERLMFY